MALTFHCQYAVNDGNGTLICRLFGVLCDFVSFASRYKRNPSAPSFA